MSQRKPYPSDVRDEEWAFVAPYLTLMRVTAKQRKHTLREVFNGLRWIARTGSPWRYMPHDLPPYAAVFQQTQRWIEAGAFAAITHDLRSLLRLLEGRTEQPSAAIFDSRSLRSTPESGARAGLDPYKKMRGSKVHMAVDTLGHLLAAVVTPASTQDRDAVARLAHAVQEATQERVEVAFVDGVYKGPIAHDAAQAEGIRLDVVTVPEGQRGFVLLPRRWVVERSFAWMSRFRRLARDYERLPQTLEAIHFIAFVCVMLSRAYSLLEIGS